MKCKWQTFFLVFTLVSLIIFGLKRVHLLVQQNRALHARFETRLESNSPYHEVRIPFQLKNGIINFDATSSGKVVHCILDTGANRVEVPAHLNLNLQETGQAGNIGDTTGNIRSRIAVLRDLRIGGLITKNLTVDCYEVMKSRASGPSTIYVSNQLFEKYVLTIDYKHKCLIVHDPTYKLQSKYINGIVVLAMKVVENAPAQRSIDVRARGRGLPFIIDTGSSSSFTISENYHKTFGGSYLKNRTCIATTRLGRLSCKVASYQFDIARLHFKGDVIVVKSENFTGGIMGYDALRHFRVTFDYPRNHLILELAD